MPRTRSVVYSTKGIVACTQPLAVQAGLSILSKGGNCCDAAVAVAACLSVLEPSSTGPGGDFFALLYINGKVTGLNGSGKSAQALTLDTILNEATRMNSSVPISSASRLKISSDSIHSITIPGTIAAWVDLIESYGSKNLTFMNILQPAIALARDGFPVSEFSARMWSDHESKLIRQNPSGSRYVPAPRDGEIRKLSGLADFFEVIGQGGKDAFYNGPVANAIIETIAPRGSKLLATDFAAHTSLETVPITASFRGYTVHEHGPNSQGIIALMVLKMIEIMESRGQIPKLENLSHNSVQYVHIVIECLKLAFGDGIWYVTDPDICDESMTNRLLSEDYLAKRSSSIQMKKASIAPLEPFSPHTKSDTVMFAITDSMGSSISVVNSLYTPFGSGIIVDKFDLLLQSRGSNFSLNPSSPNVAGPSKRPYHTIIPGMVTKDGKLVYSFGNMGGFMQPQGHVQILVNLLVFGMNVQEAVDAPRFCMDLETGDILLEYGLEGIKNGLSELGHGIGKVVDEMVFGRAQCIEHKNGVHMAGSDYRGDGHACPEF